MKIRFLLPRGKKGEKQILSAVESLMASKKPVLIKQKKASKSGKTQGNLNFRAALKLGVN
jgi:hypothetical protein